MSSHKFRAKRTYPTPIARPIRPTVMERYEKLWECRNPRPVAALWLQLYSGN